MTGNEPVTDSPRAAIACSAGTISVRSTGNGRVQIQVTRYDREATAVAFLTPAEVDDLVHILGVVKP